LVEENGVPGKNHQPVVTVTDKLYHINVVSSTPRHERCSNSQLLVVICTN
jgi:hypothetical protein